MYYIEVQVRKPQGIPFEQKEPDYLLCCSAWGCFRSDFAS
jgi:hypothetical protein